MKSLLNKIFFFISFIIISNIYAQFDIPNKPNFETSVYDYIGLLSNKDKDKLENKLIKYSDTTSTQIVIAIIKTLKGEEIGYLATNWAHKWGIGQKNKDNGVFILLAKDEKKITIRTGYGLEHLLTDFTSRQIIEQDILPYFKKSNFYKGLNEGTNSIFKVLNGEYSGKRKQRDTFNYVPLIFIIFIILFFVLSKKNKKNNGNKKYRNSDSRGFLETIILSNAGRGSFGKGGLFGDGSSGGFGGGFGGGGFGGGGATGSW